MPQFNPQELVALLKQSLKRELLLEWAREQTTSEPPLTSPEHYTLHLLHLSANAMVDIESEKAVQAFEALGLFSSIRQDMLSPATWYLYRSALLPALNKVELFTKSNPAATWQLPVAQWIREYMANKMDANPTKAAQDIVDKAMFAEETLGKKKDTFIEAFVSHEPLRLIQHVGNALYERYGDMLSDQSIAALDGPLMDLLAATRETAYVSSWLKPLREGIASWQDAGRPGSFPPDGNTSHAQEMAKLYFEGLALLPEHVMRIPADAWPPLRVLEAAGRALGHANGDNGLLFNNSSISWLPGAGNRLPWTDPDFNAALRQYPVLAPPAPPIASGIN